MTILGQLPSELLSLILDHVDKKDLYTCTLVNKQLYKEAMILLWNKLVIDTEDKHNKFTTIITTSSYSPGNHIRSLFIPITCPLSDPSLLAIISHVPFLDSLEIESGSELTDASFELIPHYCPHLTRLSVGRIGGKVTQKSMVSLGQHCRQLSVLDLHIWHGDLNPDLFFHLKTCHHHLTSIFIGFPALSLGYLQKAALALIGFPQLMFLEIYEKTNHPIGDTDFTSFFTTAVEHGGCNIWPHLTHFSLPICRTLDDDSLIPFLQVHSRLESLELCYNNKITDQTMDVIPIFLPQIKQLDVSWCNQLTVGALYRLTKNCPYLVKVNCYGCNIHVYDNDFPVNLDKRYYETWDENENDDSNSESDDQVVWFTGNAYRHNDDS